MKRRLYKIANQALVVPRVWAGLLWLILLSYVCPAVLQAQPFDSSLARQSVVRVIADGGKRIGSGSIIKIEKERAFILTGYHVIKNDVLHDISHVTVELVSEERLDARISSRYINIPNDIAVLTVQNFPSRQPISWGSSSALRDTQVVYALGHSEGGPGWAVTIGAVSRLLSGIVYFSGDAVRPGNSGGPLLNTQGEMIGMNLRLGGGLGRALESDVIRAVIRSWGVLPDEGKPPPPQDRIQGKDGKEMLRVPAGWFWMGSSDTEVEAAYQLGKKYDASTKKTWFERETPRHQVWVDSFYMDKYEVTVGEYKKFIQAKGHRELPDWVSTYSPGPSHPVVGVSWEDADAYCRWYDKQLPSEAQWEKAARGSDGRRYPWGNEAVDGKRANYCDKNCDREWKDKSEDDGYPYTAPVGSYDRGVSPYGIYNMSGNVWEWVQDWYEADYYKRSPERNPVNTITSTYRVLRGGGWDDDPANVRAAYRGRNAPGSRDLNTGFRCVVVGSAPRK